MSEAGTVRAVRVGGTLEVLIDRPKSRNAITPAMLAELSEIVATADSAVRVVTFSGAGSAFCAGADIASYANPQHQAEPLAAYTRAARDLCLAIERLDAVTVAAVHGACFGGGFEIALACDLIIAAEDARFALPEVKLGLIPGWGGTQRLTRAVGDRRAREIILRATVLDSQRALDLGIVAAIETGDLDAAVSTLASQLQSAAPRALAGAKRAILAASTEAEPSRGDRLETEILLQLFGTADANEGISAFIQKRQVEFSGR